MARIISTTQLAKDLEQTVERRTRRVCIEVTVAGIVTITAEQEDVTRVNGSPIGGPVPAGAIVLDHNDAAANPSFRMVQAAIAGAIDAKGAKIEADAAAAQIAAEAAQAAAEAAQAAAEAPAVTGEAAPIAADPA